MFQQPNSGGGYFKPAEANGHLVLILEVYKIETVVDTYGGQVRNVDEATVDIVDLDKPGDTGYPELRERVKVSSPGIVNRLVAGKKMVLGRIGQVPTDKGNPAWVLNGFDENLDAPRAAAWVSAWQAGQFGQPTAAPVIPAPAPVIPAAPAVDPAALAAAQAQLAAQAAAQAAVQVQVPAPVPAAPAAPAVDQAALAALMAQLGGQVQQ